MKFYQITSTHARLKVCFCEKGLKTYMEVENDNFAASRNLFHMYRIRTAALSG